MMFEVSLDFFPGYKEEVWYKDTHQFLRGRLDEIFVQGKLIEEKREEIHMVVILLSGCGINISNQIILQ